MKAIVFNKQNKAEALALREVAHPNITDNQVLIKVKAVSLNAADYRSIKMGIVPNGRIMGSDVAGEIVVIGKNVTNVQIGDRVAGDLSGCGFGGLAEYVAATEDALVHVPLSVSYETAAALPMASVTALQALVNVGKIQAGQKVLICGAGGGVGMFAVQLAKYFGANVTAVCGQKNVDVIRSLGADTVIDYTLEDFAKSEQRYDLVLVLNGNRSLLSYRNVMTSTGMCVMVGGSINQLIKFMLVRPFLSIGKKQMRLLSAKPSTADIEFVLKLVEEGKLVVKIDRRYNFQETPAAVAYLSEGHAGGKVIITVDQA